MTQENLTQALKLQGKVVTNYATEKVELAVPLSGDLTTLFSLDEMKEIMVHGKPLLINSANIQTYISDPDSAITNEEELGEHLARQLSPEDVEKIYNQQLHRKLVGQEFSVTEFGDFPQTATEELVLLVPKVKLSVDIVEKSLESIAHDDLTKYTTYLPPTNDEEKLNPIRIVTGQLFREFINGMQEDDGNMDMNSQLRVYCYLLTHMPDDDPTKKMGLMHMRNLMQYGDVISNKNLRLALTALMEGEESND